MIKGLRRPVSLLKGCCGNNGDDDDVVGPKDHSDPLIGVISERRDGEKIGSKGRVVVGVVLLIGEKVLMVTLLQLFFAQWANSYTSEILVPKIVHVWVVADVERKLRSSELVRYGTK